MWLGSAIGVLPSSRGLPPALLIGIDYDFLNLDALISIRVMGLSDPDSAPRRVAGLLTDPLFVLMLRAIHIIPDDCQ